jgi:hypothetical protein
MGHYQSSLQPKCCFGAVLLAVVAPEPAFQLRCARNEVMLCEQQQSVSLGGHLMGEATLGVTSYQHPQAPPTTPQSTLHYTTLQRC